MALSLTLLIGAGLFVRSLHELNARDADIARDRVLIVRVEPKGSDQRNVPGASARLDRTYRELIRQVQWIPGVEAASMAQFTPLLIRAMGATVESPGGGKVEAVAPMVYPKYFSAMGIPLLAGRDLAKQTLRRPRRRMIVNETYSYADFST